MTGFWSLVQNIKAETWFTLLGVIVGSIFTILGVYLTNRSNLKNLRVQLGHEKEFRRTEVRRERLEDLYSFVSEWNKAMLSHFLEAKLALEGHVDYNEYLDRLIRMEKPKGNLERIELITDAYAVEQLATLKEANKYRDAMNSLMQSFKVAYLRGESGERFVDPYRKLMQAFNEKCELLKTGIAAKLREI